MKAKPKTLRDEFATAAIPSLCAAADRQSWEDGRSMRTRSQEHYARQIAKLAYLVADEMMKERAR